MTSSTELDRLVASWLEAAGPADLDRETVDAALRTARKRRQRHGLLAWLVGPSSWPTFGPRRGFTALPATVRIALLVGFVLALLGASLYAGSQLLRRDDGLTTFPVLTGSWIAQKPDNLSFGTPSGPASMTLEVGPTTEVQLSLSHVAVFGSTTTTVADHEMQLVISSVGTPVAIDQVHRAACKLGDVGRYRWSLSADGALLTLASAGDTCPSREAVLVRTWSAHELPMGSWNAVPPDNLSFGTPPVGAATMDLGIGSTAEVRLSFAAAQVTAFRSTVTASADHVGFVIVSDAGSAVDTPVAIDNRLLAGCKVGDVGRYIPSLSADGTQLTLTSTGDACPSREAVLARTWTRTP